MTLNLDALPQKGKVIQVKLKGASFDVTVLDARIRYGNIDALVKPVSGSGEFWTLFSRPVKAKPIATPEALPVEASGVYVESLAEEVTDEALRGASIVGE